MDPAPLNPSSGPRRNFAQPIARPVQSDPQTQSSRDAAQKCRYCRKPPTDGRLMKQCERCKDDVYCSERCQKKHWDVHKAVCHDENLPKILIIALNKHDYLLETIGHHLLAELRKHANVVITRRGEEARNKLGDAEGNVVTADKLRAVILADGDIVTRRAQDRYDNLKMMVIEYVFSGGILVMGATFAGFVRPDRFNHFMKNDFDLMWVYGDCYHRAVVYLNQFVTNERFRGNPKLAASYSQRSVWLKYVEPRDRVYVPDDHCMTGNTFFASAQADCYQSPVCWTKVGEGWIGYIGDYNCEEESTAVILAMCGLGLQAGYDGDAGGEV